MATSNMHNLTTLIKRLEAATSRLEDIASSAVNPESGHEQDQQQNSTGQQRAASAVAGGSAPIGDSAQRAASAPNPPPPPPKEELPQMIVDFDNLIDGDLKAYHDASKAMGGLLSEQAALMVHAFQSERKVLLVSTKSKKPNISDPAYLDILKDLQKDVTSVDMLRSDNRGSEYRDHLDMIADGVGALGWVTWDTKVVDTVTELFGGAQMYGNKILSKYKNKEEAHVDWVKTFNKVMRSLIAYIKEHHPKGVQWNPRGVEPAQALEEIQSGAGAATPKPTGFGSSAPPPPPMPAGGIPTPPPPPPPGPTAAKGGQSDMGAVFADLNKGSSVTAGLKKVDPSMQTHKNPSLRAGAQVPARSDSTGSMRGKSPTPPVKAKPESMRQKKPSRKELDGNKWYIENFESSNDKIDINAELNHSILITKCKGVTIQIHGKANAITIDNSQKTNLIVDSLVSSVDVIKCPSFALQVLGAVPTVLLDQVDGGSVYLSQESLATEIFTSKCTSININLPPESEDDDYTEAPVPEQFRSYIKDGKLVTEIVEHAG